MNAGGRTTSALEVSMDKNRLNGSGYIDNTAFEAVSHVTHEEKQRRDDAAHEVIKETKALIRGRGFDVIGRIAIRDQQTGKKYR